MKRDIFGPLSNCALAIATALLLANCGGDRDAIDEASAAGMVESDYPAASADLFHDMDGGIELTPDEIKGRNSWIMWTGGNEAFWERMSRRGYGLIDFLKTIDSRSRFTRFASHGLINEPGFKTPGKPDEYGLWIDERVGPEPEGVDPAIYGRSSGILGLRLFPNPAFDAKAAKKWDAEKYYTNKDYYQDPELIRPYRVGMTCALCHIGPHPLNPPADPEKPEWANLSSMISNQYWKNRGTFGTELKNDDFFYYLLGAPKPGAVDTSIIATDYNNNPNMVNAIFELPARLGIAREETVEGGALLMDPKGQEKRKVPHILVDGADSIGVAGALCRVWVNIGMFGEQWELCHNPLLGHRKQKPFSIETAQTNSVFWNVTETRAKNVAKFLVRASSPMRLKDAPGGEAFLTEDAATVDRGKIVFAENCIACHSSKRPPADSGIEEGPVEKHMDWAHTDAFLTWAREEVAKPDFLENNYLSTDQRVPVTITQTNAARALQNNATEGEVWSEFSSLDYKNTASVGEIEVYDPFAKKDVKFTMPGGGPGFYRVPSLTSIWATAPFLHNNALGEFTGDPSVEGRMKAFDDAITKMFWKEKRDNLNSITRTTKTSYFRVPGSSIPIAIEGIAGKWVRPFLNVPILLPFLILVIAVGVFFLACSRQQGWGRKLTFILSALTLLVAIISLPLNLWLSGGLGQIELGPIPPGTPVNALANLDPNAPAAETKALFKKLRATFKHIRKQGFEDERAYNYFAETIGPDLYRLSKSPDWVEDRGHYFAEHLSDEDKLALIAFLKTF
jgi:hypothetical protein